MPKEVEIIGTDVVLEFPDTMSDDAIRNILKTHPTVGKLRDDSARRGMAEGRLATAERSQSLPRPAATPKPAVRASARDYAQGFLEEPLTPAPTKKAAKPAAKPAPQMRVGMGDVHTVEDPDPMVLKVEEYRRKWFDPAASGSKPFQTLQALKAANPTKRKQILADLQKQKWSEVGLTAIQQELENPRTMVGGQWYEKVPQQPGIASGFGGVPVPVMRNVDTGQIAPVPPGNPLEGKLRRAQQQKGAVAAGERFLYSMTDPLNMALMAAGGPLLGRGGGALLGAGMTAPALPGIAERFPEDPSGALTELLLNVAPFGLDVAPAVKNVRGLQKAIGEMDLTPTREQAVAMAGGRRQKQLPRPVAKPQPVAEPTPAPVKAPAQPTAKPAPKPATPEWVQSEIDRQNAEAERLGIADTIEELSAQGLIAKQIVSRLKDKLPAMPDEASGMVRSVRAKRGIPSQDDAKEFNEWLERRKATPAPPTAKPAPAEAGKSAPKPAASKPPAVKAPEQKPPDGMEAMKYLPPPDTLIGKRVQKADAADYPGLIDPDTTASLSAETKILGDKIFTVKGERKKNAKPEDIARYEELRGIAEKHNTAVRWKRDAMRRAQEEDLLERYGLTKGDTVYTRNPATGVVEEGTVASIEQISAYTTNVGVKVGKAGGVYQFPLESVYRKPATAPAPTPAPAEAGKSAPTYTSEEVSIANRTSRSAGRVGPHALVPRYVEETTANKADSILDFGAGKDAAHTQRLKGQGFNVTAHEFGENVREGVHDPNALSVEYDTVYASNVLNVQSSEKMLGSTLRSLVAAVKKGGRLIVNLPDSPRKMDVTAEKLEMLLRQHFDDVKRVGGTKSAPVFEAKGKKAAEPTPAADLKIDAATVRQAAQRLPEGSQYLEWNALYEEMVPKDQRNPQTRAAFTQAIEDFYQTDTGREFEMETASGNVPARKVFRTTAPEGATTRAHTGVRVKTTPKPAKAAPKPAGKDETKWDIKTGSGRAEQAQLPKKSMRPTSSPSSTVSPPSPQKKAQPPSNITSTTTPIEAQPIVTQPRGQKEAQPPSSISLTPDESARYKELIELANDSGNWHEAQMPREDTPEIKARRAELTRMIKAEEESVKRGVIPDKKHIRNLQEELTALRYGRTYRPPLEEVTANYAKGGSFGTLGKPEHIRKKYGNGRKAMAEYIALRSNEEGKPVPPEVLADYPDLAQKYEVKPTEPPPTAKAAEPKAATPTAKASGEPAKPVETASIKQKVIDLADKWASEGEAQVQKKRGTLKAGLDPEELLGYAKIGASMILRGSVRFVEWGEAMVAKYGEEIRPHLKEIWDKATTYYDNRKPEGAPDWVKEEEPKPAAPKQAAKPRTLLRPEKYDPSDTDTADAMIAEVDRLLKTPEGQAARRGVRSMEVTKQAAEKLGLTPEDIKKMPPGTAANAETMMKVSGIAQSLMRRAVQAARQAQESPTSENLAAAQLAREEGTLALMKVLGLEAESGRTQRTIQMLRQAMKYDDTKRAAAKTISDVVEGKAEEPKAAEAKTGQRANVKKPEFGSTNVLFTRERAMAARRRLAQRLAARSGVDPAIAKDVAEILGFYVEGGVRSFTAARRAFMEEMGNPAIDDDTMKAAWKQVQAEADARARAEKTPLQKVTERLVKELGEEDAKMWAEELAKINPDDPNALFEYNAILKKAGKFTIQDKALSFVQSNLLSGVPAPGMGRDIFSTGIWGAMDNFIFRYPRTVLETKKPVQAAAETMNALKGTVKGTVAGMKEAMNVIIHGYDTEQANMLDLPVGFEFRGGGLNPFNAIKRIRSATNEIQRYMAMGSEAEAQAYRLAKAEGLTGKALQQRMNDLKAEMPEEMLERVRDYGKRMTFTDDADKFLSLMYVARNAPIQIGNMTAKPLQFAFPFVRTMYNFTKRGMELTPAGFIKAATAETSAARADYFVRASMGSAFMVALTPYALNGYLTGGSPNATEYERRRKAGIPDYSVRVGDNWVEYKNWGPIMIPMAIMAAFGDQFREGHPPAEKNVFKAAGEVANVLVDQTALLSLTIMADSLLEGKPEKFVGNELSKLVPFISAQRAASKSADPWKRDPEKWYEWVMDGTPLRQELPIKKDSQDNPIPNRDVGLFNSYSPMRVQPYRRPQGESGGTFSDALMKKALKGQPKQSTKPIDATKLMKDALKGK